MKNAQLVFHSLTRYSYRWATNRKPGEAVDCGGPGDQRVHGQNEKMLREGGPLIRITFNSLARLRIPCYKLHLPAHASILVFPCVQKSITESLQI